MDQERKKSNSSPELALREAEHEEERDEEKIDKFFAIIKRLREARHVSSSSTLQQMEAQREKKAKKIQAPWTPSFQLEDFAGLAGLRTAGTCTTTEKEICAQEEKHEIDLNLAL
ncbi:unnamed protein product [Linum tenue]|uniref:Uncharacterized protein n=1 Tax=Linum tenue TaxID=586396 RepID=A0AAV0HA37_9ROSI|nr:unnamed protein product [Linum tenue]